MYPSYRSFANRTAVLNIHVAGTVHREPLPAFPMAKLHDSIRSTLKPLEPCPSISRVSRLRIKRAMAMVVRSKNTSTSVVYSSRPKRTDTRPPRQFPFARCSHPHGAPLLPVSRDSMGLGMHQGSREKNPCTIHNLIGCPSLG